MTLTRPAAADLAQKWIALWNGDLALTDQILRPDFRIDFGAVVAEPDPTLIATPAGMAAFVHAWRSRGVEMRFALDGPPAVDEEGVIAFLWTVDVPGTDRRSGIDLVRVVDERIAHVWSVTGARAFG